MKTISLHEAKENFGRVVDSALKAPVSITKQGQPAVIVASNEDFQEFLESKQLREEVKKGFDQIDRGQFSTRSMDELFEEAMKRVATVQGESLIVLFDGMHVFKNSEYADEDIMSILAYTADQWDYEQALIYKRILEKGRDCILEDPYLMGSKSRDELTDGCRSFRVKHHYFMYRLKNDTVEFARILHESMDFHKQMKNTYFPE